MILEKEYIIELFDVYKNLLTEKQKEYFSMYYFMDFSLGEIASDLNITRNAIHDQIKKAEKLLIEYEIKLGLLKKEKEQLKKISELENKYNIDLSSLKND